MDTVHTILYMCGHIYNLFGQCYLHVERFLKPTTVHHALNLIYYFLAQCAQGRLSKSLSEYHSIIAAMTLGSYDVAVCSFSSVFDISLLRNFLIASWLMYISYFFPKGNTCCLTLSAWFSGMLQCFDNPCPTPRSFNRCILNFHSSILGHFLRHDQYFLFTSVKVITCKTQLSRPDGLFVSLSNLLWRTPQSLGAFICYVCKPTCSNWPSSSSR